MNKFFEGMRTGKNANLQATEGDVAAFRRFMVAFDCEDSETFQEAHEKINASMEDIGDKMDAVDFDDYEAQQEIIYRRYAKLPKAKNGIS